MLSLFCKPQLQKTSVYSPFLTSCRQSSALRLVILFLSSETFRSLYTIQSFLLPQFFLLPLSLFVRSASLESQPLLLLVPYLVSCLSPCFCLCLVWLRVSPLVLACVLSASLRSQPLLLLLPFPLFTSPPDARFFIDARLSLLFVQKTVSPLFSHLSFITNFYHPSAAVIHVSLSEHHSQKLLLFLIIRLILVRPTFTFLNHFYSLALESSLSCKKYSLLYELLKAPCFLNFFQAALRLYKFPALSAKRFLN